MQAVLGREVLWPLASVLIVLLTSIPLLWNPQLFTATGDLAETHWTAATFIRRAIGEAGEFPLWRTDILSGMPLIGDPIHGMWYPPNLALLLPGNLETTFIVLLIGHLVLNAVGFFSLLRYGFGLRSYPAFAGAVAYGLAPNVFAHVSAGHFTMIEALPWLPLSLLAFQRVLQTRQLFWCALCALAVSLAYLADLRIFFYSMLALAIYFIFSSKGHFYWWHLFSILAIASLSLGLAALLFLPSIELATFSTRSQMSLNDATVYSLNQLGLQSLILGQIQLNQWGPEHFLYLGLIPLGLAVYALISTLRDRGNRWTQPTWYGLFLSIFSFAFAIGKWSPVYLLFWFLVPPTRLLRVPERIWFLVVFSCALLVAVALLLLMLVDLSSVDMRLLVAQRHQKTFLPNSVYELLAPPPASLYRVYSTNHALSQKQAVEWGIPLADGENPNQLASYVQFLRGAGGYQYSGYSMVAPPWEDYVYRQSQPDASLLGELSVRYVLSPHRLEDPRLSLQSTTAGLNIYLNSEERPRASLKLPDEQQAPVTIELYEANRIIVSGESSSGGKLILSEVWYPGWKAWVNGERVEIGREESLFRSVEVRPGRFQAELFFEPLSFRIGLLVSIFTLLSALFLTFSPWGRLRIGKQDGI